MCKFSFNIHFYDEGKPKVDDFDLYKREFKKYIGKGDELYSLFITIS